MDEITKKAILNAIRIEKTSYDFYLIQAGRTVNPETYRFFIKLAGDEFIHLTGFLRLYPGDGSELAAYLQGDPDTSSGGSSDLWMQIPVPVSLEEALTIAINEEQACIDLYATFVESLRLPEVHAMFTKALDETRQHLETIKTEYDRCRGMVSNSDRDNSAGE